MVLQGCQSTLQHVSYCCIMSLKNLFLQWSQAGRRKGRNCHLFHHVSAFVSFMHWRMLKATSSDGLQPTCDGLHLVVWDGRGQKHPKNYKRTGITWNMLGRLKTGPLIQNRFDGFRCPVHGGLGRCGLWQAHSRQSGQRMKCGRERGHLEAIEPWEKGAWKARSLIFDIWSMWEHHQQKHIL